ncbi:MAG: GNAT family N-acetyltransferase [Bacteroidales bacterium]|nr:GNAT family N-acetyltransferase [Bacteroidales bacterium]
MLSFRNTIVKEDFTKIEKILRSTGFFEQAPDEIYVAVELAELALKDGNTVENYEFIFAEEDDQVVGFGCFARIPCTLSSFEIYWLGVDKQTQGKGVGKKIIHEIMNETEKFGGKKIVLQTAGREQYLPTQKFYTAVGFDLEARIKDYYADGDDCLIYTITLNA